MRLPFRQKSLNPYALLEHLETVRAVKGIILAFVASILVVAIEVGLQQFSNIYHPFVITLFAVVISSWYGGVRPGIVATGLIVLIDGYIFFPFFKQSAGMFHLFSFIVVGSAISYSFERIKNTEEIRLYKRREKENAILLTRLQEETERAREAVKARDEFLSIASHELKSPLTSMLLNIQTILHSVKNVSLAEFSVQHLMKMLESAESQSKRASKMVNDLLNVSLITTGRMELEKEKVNLSKLTADMLINFEERIKKENYTVTSFIQEDVTGYWDKIRIEQVLTNLIVNALKYGNNKPIEIRVKRIGQNAIFSIQDHGIGIPKEVQQRIFNRFERGTNTGNNTIKGLGIGLYITSQIIKAHQGKIEVESEKDQGTKFSIILPAKE